MTGQLTKYSGTSCNHKIAVGIIRRVFVSLFHMQWTKAHSAISKSRPLLSLLIFRTSSPSKASPLLHPSAVQWCDNLNLDNKKIQHSKAQHNTRLPYRGSQREGGRSAALHLPFFSVFQAFCFCCHWVYGGWIAKTKQGCDVERVHGSQSPPQRQESLTNGGRNWDLDFTQWYRQLR